MIYHRWSLTGLMLWAWYGLLRGRPATSLNEIYRRHLESPGTKAYTRAEAEALRRRAGLTSDGIPNSTMATCLKVPRASGTAGRC